MTTPASRTLRDLARTLAQPYAALPQCRAIILTGSAADGESDTYSDLDMILYYDALPSEEQLAAASETNKGEKRRHMIPPSETGAIDTYLVNGIDCQFAHITVAEWENDMAAITEKLEVATPTQKALSGLLKAIPLHGEPLIRQWQERLAVYPDALAEAMVKHHLSFFAIWGLQDQLGRRDATIWVTETLVGIAQNLLGVMAGLNRLYYSPFQFKRMHPFIEKMTIKPENFAERVEDLFRLPPRDAAFMAEALVSETAALVQQHMPQIDTARATARIGWRQQAWTLPE